MEVERTASIRNDYKVLLQTHFIGYLLTAGSVSAYHTNANAKFM
jgi:hypothetical protein